MGWYEDLVVLIGIAVAILLLFAPPVHGVSTSSYLYSKNVSCPTSAALPSQPDLPCAISFNHAAEVALNRSLFNGTDLYLVNATGFPEPFEIENNTANTSATILWITVPQFNNSLNWTGTLYFGNNTPVADQQNKSGVWGTTYDDVYHFGENSSQLYSSGVQGTNLTYYTGLGIVGPGSGGGCQYGNCLNATANGGYWSASYPAKYTNPSTVAESCKILDHSLGAYEFVMGFGNAVAVKYSELIDSTGKFASYGTGAMTGSTASVDKWYLFGMNITNGATNNVTIWTDGVQNATGQITYGNPVASNFSIGALATGNLEKFSGLIDECRITTNASVIQNWGTRMAIEAAENSSVNNDYNGGNVTIKAYDMITLNPIYFTATIASSSASVNIPYGNYYSNYSALLPTGFVTVTVSNTTYKPINYYFTNSPTGATFNAYLVNATGTNTASINFVIQNQGATPIPNATINIYKSISGTWVLVGQKISDSSGIGNFFMDTTTQYQVMVSAEGYSNFVTYVTPAASSYVITMAASGQGAMGFVSRNAGTDWMVNPNSPWNETATIPLTFTVVNQNCTLQWFAMLVYNGTTLKSLQNDTTDFCGNSLTYNFVPGPNATISVVVQFQNQNLSVFSQTLYMMTYAPTSPSGAGPNEIKSDLSNAFSPFAISLIFLVISVMIGGWVGQFSPTFGIFAFLIVITMGFWLGYGLLGAGAILMMAILGAVAYQSIRGGFG